MIDMRHPNKESKQIVYSDRDAAWLEKQGWYRAVPEKKPDIEAESAAPVQTLKRRIGRPRKVENESP